uniref:Histidinol dehydrogenase n=1 Tax=Fervidicoccus fontis TaxID=683846 RepID=A0A7J3ZLP1_9CREN
MIGPKKIESLTEEERHALLERGVLLESLENSVREIVERVAEEGDRALVRYTKIFDGVDISVEDLVVSEREIKRAYETISRDTLRALERAYEHLERFHREQMPPENIVVETAPGCFVALTRKAISKIGAYVPGGKRPYPSTALMLTVPARVAGCKKVVACTPPRRDKSVDPAVLVALDMGGASAIYRVGGAQAIAAMAFGTETIERVDKIVGPGGAYVTIAKKIVFGRVGIDMLAGPSEILILADETAQADYIVADMLAQLEHGTGSCAVLVSLSEKLAFQVYEAFRRRGEFLSNQSAGNTVAFLVAESLEEAVAFVNEFAPEHLEIVVENPMEVAREIENAGSISLGISTPAALSDYITGSNHVLPTSGTARYRGALTVFDLLKFIPVQLALPSSSRELAEIAIKLAESENMYLHARSLRARVGRT